MGAGALQPVAVLQVANPRPCRAPTMSPPLSIEGTTATQRARFSTGGAMEFLNCATSTVESSNRSASSRLADESFADCGDEVVPEWEHAQSASAMTSIAAAVPIETLCDFIDRPSSWWSLVARPPNLALAPWAEP